MNTFPLDQLKYISLTAIALLATSNVIAHEKEDRYTSGNNVYKIELHNATSTQWFSPILCVLHHKKLRLFQDGKAASTGQATFAEDGYSGVFASELEQNKYVYSVLIGGPGLTPPDATLIEYISGPRNARLTCAAMPVTTNDVLTTIQSTKLPKYIGSSRHYASTEWDLGSEFNSYSASSMPEDSGTLTAEDPDNPVTIADNVVFGAYGRPNGVPTLLSPFTRSYIDESGKLSAEGTMRIFTDYEGSADFPNEIYGWQGSASHFLITRIE